MKKNIWGEVGWSPQKFTRIHSTMITPSLTIYHPYKEFFQGVRGTMTMDERNSQPYLCIFDFARKLENFFEFII